MTVIFYYIHDCFICHFWLNVTSQTVASHSWMFICSTDFCNAVFCIVPSSCSHLLFAFSFYRAVGASQLEDFNSICQNAPNSSRLVKIANLFFPTFLKFFFSVVTSSQWMNWTATSFILFAAHYTNANIKKKRQCHLQQLSAMILQMAPPAAIHFHRICVYSALQKSGRNYLWLSKTAIPFLFFCLIFTSWLHPGLNLMT